MSCFTGETPRGKTMSGAFKTIGGIDEAGKGSVIGPMVVAGISCEREFIRDLKEYGIRDSKKLTPGKRREFYNYIRERAFSAVRVFDAKEIDSMRKERTINEILFSGFEEIAEELACSTIYVDSPDVNRKRFGEKLEKRCGKRIFSLHKADEMITVVMAASIVAKVERDSRIDLIKKTCGVDFGSGYPSDPKTREFLSECIDIGRIPDFIRSSWKTMEKIKDIRFNTKIESWL